MISSISGLVVEYIVAIDVTRVPFPADALLLALFQRSSSPGHTRNTGKGQKNTQTAAAKTNSDTCGMRAHVGRPHQLSRPTPQPLGQSVIGYKYHS